MDGPGLATTRRLREFRNQSPPAASSFQGPEPPGGQPKVSNLPIPSEASSANTGTKSEEQTQRDGERTRGREGGRRGRDTDGEADRVKDGDRERQGREMHAELHRKGGVGKWRAAEGRRTGSAGWVPSAGKKVSRDCA